jgi:uncharacterized protein with NAD-binding domain and iron-sulfur cluster
MGGKPIKVAIVGGGCAGIATAFELTRPEHAGKYAVVVYQLGWRLGGKGASGRGAADRIEEHGLHLWMGFYENAFRLVRECYRELGRDPAKQPLARWEDAFVPDHFCGVMDRTMTGGWEAWTSHLPAMEGAPGDPDLANRSWTMTDYVSRSVKLVQTLIEAVQARTGELSDSSKGQPLTPNDAVIAMNRMLQFGGIASLTALIESLRLLDQIVEALPNYPTDMILRFHDAISRAARQQIDRVIGADSVVRRLWEITDLLLATIRGVIRSGLLTDPRGFDAINDYDCRQWLKLHGASDLALDGAFLRGLYDLAFAYENGDVTRPRIAAGQALRGAMRAFFTYRGAFFWKMQAGMGDAVFAPFYEVLKRRGVRFEFFHRLRNVRLNAPRRADPSSHVAALEFDVQAKTRSRGEYRPLREVRGLPSWPSEPDWDQLVDGARLRREAPCFESDWDSTACGTKTLEVSRHFDLVVLSVGPGALANVCRELIERDPRWRTMVDQVKSVATQALQLWMTEARSDLGWKSGPVNLTGFVEPFDTWADMSHLVAMESFEVPVRSIAYFCSVLPDRNRAVSHESDVPNRRRSEVRESAIRFLNEHVRHLWPDAIRPHGEFRWEILVAPDDRKRKGRAARPKFDSARIDTQFFAANINASDRYSLSLPGSLQYRISPLDTGFDNLTIAGDWTDCGFNEGCVEAAVMSGRLAAHALSKSPPLADIIGFDHP